ncbi:MAG: sialate O-acetylesterase [Verrucomicrobiota bacterium]
MSSRIPAIAGLVLWAMAVICWANPVLYLIGDSTVRTGTAGQQGWGDALVPAFDPAKIEVINRAIGGRSSRTYLTEGRWDALLANLKAGDFVLMQFGHNDGGPLNDERCRASIKGNGDESEDIVRKPDGKPETVHSYGWYLRKYASEATAKGAIPIVISPIPRNIWKDGKVTREEQGLSLWAKQAAAQQGALFIDFNRILADRFDALGQAKTAGLFAGTDHTHTAPAGAEFNAAAMIGALRTLAGCQLAKCLLDERLWLPAVFGDHMVLQRDKPLAVWGMALPGAAVVVKLAGHTATSRADDKGAWKVELAALAAGGPYQLEVAAGAEARSYADVLMGDVWLCSGQSNMDFTLAKTAKRSFSGAADWDKEVAAADHPQLRMFSAEWAMNERPQRELAGAWVACSPQTAGEFSAVAYYFGRSLQQQLKVSVGLVTSAYGASTIEAWMREECLAAHPQFSDLLHAMGKKALAYRDDPKFFLDYGNALAKAGRGRAPKNPDPYRDQHNPSVLHNGMIAPLVPYGIRGVIWYQGESNLNTRKLYPDLQEALIGDWRQQWNDPALPFYFVQLAAYKAPAAQPSGGQLPEMREAQAKALALPHTGMAVTIDIGDEKDVHPRNKLDVGKRLARLALTDAYGQAGEASGPVLRGQELQNGRIRLRFDHAEGGLVAKGGPLRQFAIAAADRKFVWAEAVVEGDSVMVSSPAIGKPVFVRYAWADNPAGANLYNSAGLPAAPFRSDP